MTSEDRGQRSPLQSDHGRTTVREAVVANIARQACRESSGSAAHEPGARLPGDHSPTVGDFVGNLTGNARTPGISVEVGERQAAVDLSVTVDYGEPIPGVAQRLRDAVIRGVEQGTGLEVTEVNVTVSDLSFPNV